MQKIWNRGMVAVVAFVLLAGCRSSAPEEELLRQAMHENIQRQIFLMNSNASTLENYMRGTAGGITETLAPNFVTQAARIYEGDTSVNRRQLMLDSLKTLFRQYHYHESESVYLKEPLFPGDVHCRQADMLNYGFDLSMHLFSKHTSIYCGFWTVDPFSIVPSQQRKGYYYLIPYSPAEPVAVQPEVHTAAGAYYPALHHSASGTVYMLKIPLHAGVSHIYWTDSTRGYPRTYLFSGQAVKRVYRTKIPVI